MLRILFLSLVVGIYPLAAPAAETRGQIPLSTDQVLRGHFVQESHIDGFTTPVQSSGHFILAPAHGLIWDMEKPMPTSTIITPKGSVQNFGGLIVKLPIKNLQHLYAVIGGALMGDWSGLQKDFEITSSNDADPWQMLLTPRHTGKSLLSYASITVSGQRFVENIVLVKADGSTDTLSFTDEVLAPALLTADEATVFSEADKVFN